MRPGDERAMSQAPSTDGSSPRVILVTGSSSGIGRALARRFAERGWRVFATMRAPDGEKGGALRDEAAARGWRLTTPALDVTRDDSVRAAVEAALAETAGRIDVLVNNAGYYAFGSLEETTPDELRAQLETNVIGVQRVTRVVLVEPGPYESDLHVNERLAAASRRPDSPYAAILAAYARQAKNLKRAPL